MAQGGLPRDSSVSKLVERQMRNWELARAQRHDVAPDQRDAVADFVCVSRSVGVSGNEVAAILAEKLGWPVFDKQILELMAGDNELRRRVYESMDERDLSWCEETLGALVYPELRRNDYFRRLTKTVLSLARQGNGVFLGRGADLILPRELGFRVRLVAPRDQRIQSFIREHGLPEDEAARRVDELEQERAEFLRHHFHVDPGDPVRYDLVINLACFAPAQAAALVLHARDIRTRG